MMAMGREGYRAEQPVDAPTRQLGVWSALDDVDGGLERVKARLNDLQGRLESVLSPEQPWDVSEKREESPVTAIERLEKVSDQLNHMHEQLDRLLVRLEV